MQCPSCKEQIDDDSRYCDQCGEQLMVCSVCGRPGKGKRCIFDGKEMVPAGSNASTGAAVSAPAPAAQPVQAIQPTQSPPPVQPVQPPQPTQSTTSNSSLPLPAQPTPQPTQPPQPVQPAPAFKPVPTSSIAPSPAQQVPPAPQTPPVQFAPQAATGDKIKLSSPMHGIMIEAGNGDIIGRKNGPFAGVFGRFNYISGTHCKIVKTTGWHIQDMGSTNGTFYNGSRLPPNAPYPLVNGTTIKIADLELTVSYDIGDGGTSRL